MNRILALSCFLLLYGCATTPVVEPTKQWEGHYFSKQDAVAAVENIELGKNESIWIVSNSTLKRLLNNVGGK